MFENLTLIAIIVILFWVAIFVYYMVTSRQQNNLQQDIEELEQMLGDETRHDE